MGVRSWIEGWPGLPAADRGRSAGPGGGAKSARSARLQARTGTADRVVASICPYCAVGCGQRIYVRDEQVIQIEGDPDSPVSRGRLCPKGSASRQLVTGPTREIKVRYRRPHAIEWEELDLDIAIDMIADRVIETRPRCDDHSCRPAVHPDQRAGRQYEGTDVAAAAGQRDQWPTMQQNRSGQAKRAADVSRVEQAGSGGPGRWPPASGWSRQARPPPPIHVT